MTSNNIYIEILRNKFNDSKYKHIYLSLIDRAYQRTTREISLNKQRKEANLHLGYTEAHHIIPKCMYSLVEDIDNKSNIVFLTAREHFIAHRLLVKLTKETHFHHKMIHSLAYFCSNNNNFRQLTSKQFELARLANYTAAKNRLVSDETKLRMSKAQTGISKGKGVNKSNEHKQKIKEALLKAPRGAGHWGLGIKKTKEHCENISKGQRGISKNKGKLKSLEHRQKIGEANRRRGARSEETKEKIRSTIMSKEKLGYNGRSTDVTIEGVTYKSFKLASKATGISVYKIKKEYTKKY